MTGRKSPDDDERVERLARSLVTSGDEDAEPFDDIETARRAAAARLEDSEARTFDPAVTDPDDEGVIRRSSEETTPDEGTEGGSR